MTDVDVRRTRVPESLCDELREAFDLEVATRVPPLRRAAARLRRHGTEVPAGCVRTIVTHVHALASSGVIVGDHAVARAARDCEQRLLAYVDGERMPSVVVESAGEALALLLAHLDRLPSAASG